MKFQSNGKILRLSITSPSVYIPPTRQMPLSVFAKTAFFSTCLNQFCDAGTWFSHVSRTRGRSYQSTIESKHNNLTHFESFESWKSWKSAGPYFPRRSFGPLPRPPLSALLPFTRRHLTSLVVCGPSKGLSPIGSPSSSAYKLPHQHSFWHSFRSPDMVNISSVLRVHLLPISLGFHIVSNWPVLECYLVLGNVWSRNANDGVPTSCSQWPAQVDDCYCFKA